MIDVKEFEEYLKDVGVGFYCGVPDSQLKSFCNYIYDKYGISDKHIIAPNEGNAVAFASGYHLSTGKIGLVYMQNSGLGNAVNPITSLTDPHVYNIPVIYIIGWRGEPGIKDEPQHVKQGAITTELLETLDIDYEVLTQETTMDDIKSVFENKFNDSLKNGRSVGFVISKNVFDEYKVKYSNSNTLTREDAIKSIVDYLTLDDIIISTTGKTSRELFEYREYKNQGHNNDFLTVGSMGHSSTLALSIALNKKDKRIICFDGDGAVLMHMGSIAMIGSKSPENYYHVIFNNEAHESVGGLPTIIKNVDISKVALSCNYNKTFYVNNEDDLLETLPKFFDQKGPNLLIIDVSIYSRSDLGRPTTTPIENKNSLMKKLQE